MNEILENIKKILESEASLLVVIKKPDDIMELSKKGNHVEKKVVDNRFEHIKQFIDSVDNKDVVFYSELIRVISTFIDQLYDRNIDFCNVEIVNTDDEVEFLDTICFNSRDSFILRNANHDLSKELFEFLCNILDSNKDIKLDIETLKRLLNRNPKLFTLSVEESYIDRPFQFDRLARIINKNLTLQKSNVSLDETYQLLIDTCQVDKDEVFKNLVTLEEFKENHQKIDELLMWCNARTFIEVTRIIRTNYDNDVDRFSIAKKRNKNKFCERLIIELLHWHADEEDCDLIHQILTDSEIEIDYDLYLADYTGETDLKSIIALSGNRTIIKDLLSQEKNIQNGYGHGDYGVRLYELYAIIGEYEKAISNFEEKYNFKYDLDDEDKNWDRSGFAYGSWGYKDSIASFISGLCDSFKDNSVDYSMIVNLISRVINSEHIKYVNLTETLTPLQEILQPDDFKLLVDTLMEKYNSGNLDFLVVTDHQSMFTRYKISIASEDEVQEQLNALNKIVGNRSLIYSKKDSMK